MFQAAASHLVIAKRQLDKMHDEKMPSTGAQNVPKSIQISENRYRTDWNEAQCQIGWHKKLIETKHTNLACQEEKTEMKLSNILHCHK